jgi:formate dehydrogenase subunit gamma
LRRTIAALDHHIESSDLIYTAHPGTFQRCIFRPACREAHGNRPEELLEILHDAQDAFGFAAKDLSAEIAQALNISRTKDCGVIGFYHDYRREPPGRHIIELCRAEAWQSVNGWEGPDE